MEKKIQATKIKSKNSEQVELYFSMKNLNYYSPYCHKVRYLIWEATKSHQKKQKTKALEISGIKILPEKQDIVNFTKSLSLEWIFEIHQCYIIEFLALESEHDESPELVGKCEFELGQVVGSRGNKIEENILNSIKPP